MKLVLSKDELIETENEVFKLKIIIPIIGILMYISSILFKFTKYPLLPWFYLAIIYGFILTVLHLNFKKLKIEKFVFYNLFLSIIEIIFTTIIIYFTGGITSSVFVIYLIIILSISAYRVPIIPYIIGLLSYLSYLILVFGQYFGIFKHIDYFSSETFDINFPFVFQRSIIVGLYIMIFSTYANIIIMNLNKEKRTQDLLRNGALLLTSYLGDREKFTTNILKIARELVEADTASIIEIRNGEYKFVAWENIDSEVLYKIEEGFKINKPQNLEEIRETKQLLKFDDVWKVPYWIKIVDLRSYIGVPILFKNEVVAILNVDSKKPNKFKDRDLRNLEIFSKIISTSYEKDEMIKEIKELNLRLENLSLTDPLTNLFNRRKFKEIVVYNIDTFLRRKENFQIIMLDIDNFKLINDNFGHLEGDNCLIKFAGLLKKNVRKVDFVFRYGGDEFLILLPNTPPPTADIVVERINKGFKEIFIDLINSLNIGISYGSINFSEYFTNLSIQEKELDSELIYENILKELDKSLYYSKRLKKIS